LNGGQKVPENPELAALSTPILLGTLYWKDRKINNFIGIIASVILICLSGCGQSAKQEQQVKDEKAKQIMGDGNKPMPKPGQNIGGL